MLTSHRRRNDAPLQRQAVVPFGSGRNPGMAGNQRVNSLSGLCRSQHQVQVGASHGESRSSLTNRPASGNWCRTQGGMTELPPQQRAKRWRTPSPTHCASRRPRYDHAVRRRCSCPASAQSLPALRRPLAEARGVSRRRKHSARTGAHRRS